MKIKKVLGLILLRTVGEVLPSANSLSIAGKIGKSFRNVCGRLYLDKCGDNVNIYKRAKFSSRVSLGNGSDIGFNSYIQGKCYIGNDVMMARECHIWTLNHNTERTDIPMRIQGTKEEAPVYIGDDVWIGSRVTILPGVRIGAHAVIGAGAVVSKDIPEYGVAVGNPAKVVRFRNNKSLPS